MCLEWNFTQKVCKNRSCVYGIKCFGHAERNLPSQNVNFQMCCMFCSLWRFFANHVVCMQIDSSYAITAQMNSNTLSNMCANY